MAERRMFSKQIIDSDMFLDMPVSAQALYFHLAMRADDEGFLNNPSKIMKIVGANKNDMDLLLVKRFIIDFPSGIIVIKHWFIHNYIQNDRFKQTVYKEERLLLDCKENKVYTLRSEQLNLFSEDQKNESGYSLDTQVSLVKVSKDKYLKESDKEKTDDVSITKHPHGELNNVYLSEDEIEKLRTKYPNIYEQYIEKLSNYIASKGRRYKSHYAVIRTWIMNDAEQNGGPKDEPEFEYKRRDER